MMMSQILHYIGDIHFFYSDAFNVASSHRDSTNAEWAVVKFLVHFITPVIEICVVNAASDSTYIAIYLHEDYLATANLRSEAGQIPID